MRDKTTKTTTTIDHRQVDLDDTFRHRSGPESENHLAGLRRTLRNVGRLDPIIVWREIDKQDQPTGRMVLLDGRYRLGAYRAEHAENKVDATAIPAMVVQAPRTEAHLIALQANAKEILTLTTTERTNAAWWLVREFRNELSKSRLAIASGVAARTIANMRAKLREFDEAKETPSGDWVADRNWPEESSWTPPTDEEMEAQIEQLAEAFKAAVREIRTRDVAVIAEAMERALGQRQITAIADYLGIGGMRDEGDDIGTGYMEPDEFEQRNFREALKAN